MLTELVDAFGAALVIVGVVWLVMLAIAWILIPFQLSAIRRGQREAHDTARLILAEMRRANDRRESAASDRRAA